MIGKPISELTDVELETEWRMWNDRIKGATGWGAALAAADEFRRDCEQEMRRRNMPPPSE